MVLTPVARVRCGIPINLNNQLNELMLLASHTNEQFSNFSCNLWPVPDVGSIDAAALGLFMK